VITFNATTGDVSLPYAQYWTREQWAYMAQQADTNPNLMGTVVASGIKLLAARIAAGEQLSEYEISIWLGGAWTGPIENLGGTVTLAPGETLTPEGLIGPGYTGPPPTTSGAIPPGPTDNVLPAPQTIPVNPNVTLVSPTPSGSTLIPSTGTDVPQVLPTVKVTATPNGIPGWVFPVAVIGVILFLISKGE